MNLFSFLPLWLLSLARGKVYPSISEIRQHYPAIVLEGYIFAYSNGDFQIPLAKIYHNVNFQLTSSCKSEDIQIMVSLRTLLSVMLGENGKFQCPISWEVLAQIK